MANQDRPQGALPVKHLNGSPFNGQTNTYVIMAADVNQYFVGDFVKSAANGDLRGVPAVTKAEDGQTLTQSGIFITSPGSGGTPGSYALSIFDNNGSGTGATGVYVIGISGVLESVVITAPGSGYVAPVLSFPLGSIVGAMAIVTVTPGWLRGAIVAIEPNLTDLSLMTIPVTKVRNYYVEVSDATDVVYEMQVNNTANFLVTDLNKNANFVVALPATVPPNAYSGTEVDAATIATTQALPLKLLGIVQRADVDLTANTKVLVVINQHELMGNTAGV